LDWEALRSQALRTKWGYPGFGIICRRQTYVTDIKSEGLEVPWKTHVSAYPSSLDAGSRRRMSFALPLHRFPQGSCKRPKVTPSQRMHTGSRSQDDRKFLEYFLSQYAESRTSHSLSETRGVSQICNGRSKP
jgi:hypothetical protein